MSVELTELLERTPTPPMGIDPQAILDGGRRRVARRRAVTVVASLAAALALAAAAPAIAGRSASHTSAPVATRPSTGDTLLLGAPKRMEFDQTGTDGQIRSYRVIVTANQSLGRNEARLYLLEPSNAPVLIGAVALSHPERGPVDGNTDSSRGLVWGIGPVSGNTRANYTLQDGTTFSAPIRRLSGTRWEVSVIDGLTAAQRQEAGSATDDRGVPVLR